MANYEKEMDEKRADELLQNVFKAAGQAPNTIPIDQLVAKREERIRGLRIARMAAMCLLILTLMAPVAFKDSLYQDTRGPIVTEDTLKNGLLTIQVKGVSADIDYENIRAKAAGGEVILPEDTDEENGIVIFADPKENLEISIPDKLGNTTHLLFFKDRERVRRRRSLWDVWAPTIPQR